MPRDRRASRAGAPQTRRRRQWQQSPSRGLDPGARRISCERRFERFDERGRRRVSPIGLFGERPVEDRFDRRRQLSALGRAQPAREELVGDHREREPVARRGRALAGDLLGRHVPRRAHDLTPCGQRGLAVAPRDAEVGDVDVLVCVEEEVLRLDVPVDDSGGMGVVERLGRLLEPAHGLRAGRCAALPQTLGEAPVRHVLEHDVRAALPLARLECRDDVRMRAELSCQRRFAREPLPRHRVRDELFSKDLDCHVPGEQAIPGEIDRAHPAPSEQPRVLEPRRQQRLAHENLRHDMPGGRVTPTVARTSSASALRVGPGVAGADVNRERRVERIRRAHLLAHELLHHRRLCVGDLEQQLVVHLEDEPRASPLLP